MSFAFLLLKDSGGTGTNTYNLFSQLLEVEVNSPTIDLTVSDPVIDLTCTSPGVDVDITSPILEVTISDTEDIDL